MEKKFWSWRKTLEQRGGSCGQKGQIAIFVALIFQVLFVFFAMVVNVGLIVHHKINLQNSVDLAAYYGAMKQAEVMNAVAHVNYQLRQAYKLLIWRYRHVGMAGETYSHPYDSLGGSMRGTGNVDQEFKGPDGAKCSARFCVNYPVFNIQEPNEYYCRDICREVKITLLGVPSVSGINFALAEGMLGGLARSIEEASKALVDKTRKHCRERSALNWFALARFIVSYKQEQQARKAILNHLANSISYATEDLQDIDGESVRKGVLTTLYRNLSYPNQEQIDPVNGGKGGGNFKFYNSLGDPNCSGSKGEKRIPPKWLNEVFLKPLYISLQGLCDGATSVGYKPTMMNSGDGSYSGPLYGDGLDPAAVNTLVTMMADPGDLNVPVNRSWHTTLGVEKNPWCMAYVAVEAATTPKVPFNPFGPVKLKARAFAKPFGGTIGPWYYNKWPQGSRSSQGGIPDRVDPTLPPRVTTGEVPPGYTEHESQPDFSRYTGDKIGNKSTMTMGHVAKALWDKHRPPSQAAWDIWSHLPATGSGLLGPDNTGDTLAWSPSGSVPVMRDLELGFILPDQFDVTYYSIEPDFWRNYALRLRKRSDLSGVHIRGDLGYRRGAGAPWETMSIKSQIERGRTQNFYAFNSPLTYYIGAEKQPAEAFVETLTGWHMIAPGDYKLQASRFGNCPPNSIVPYNTDQAEIAVPGNCMAGGRTGYSVKLVDGEYLQSPNLEIGGQGQTGRLLNPWVESPD